MIMLLALVDKIAPAMHEKKAASNFTQPQEWQTSAGPVVMPTLSSSLATVPAVVASVLLSLKP